MRWEWAYDGVNPRIPRNTGPECADYLTSFRRTFETIVIMTICCSMVRWGYKNLQPIPNTYYNRLKANNGDEQRVNKRVNLENNANEHDHNPAIKRFLLILMTFILGLEVGFKISSRTVIYILNPCHITSVMQIYLLAARPCKSTTALFRIQMNYMNGPLLAFVFPETDSRQIPAEAAIYWIQHALMCIIPLYLLRLGGCYTMEKLTDMTWPVISYALLIIYHFTVLQGFGLPAQVNLNHMLCPAILDPFEGQNYRIAAFIHQSMLCPILCKLMCLFAPSNQQLIVAHVRQLMSSSSKQPTIVSNSITADHPTSSSSSSLTTTADSHIGNATNGTNRQQQPENIDNISDNNQLLITNCENRKIDKID